MKSSGFQNGAYRDGDRPGMGLEAGVTPTKTVKSNSLNEALTSAATAVVSMLKTTPESPQQSSSPMSPAKRAHVSGAYLEHLDKLKKLLESGVLSQEEFAEQKKYILGNLVFCLLILQL